MAMSAEHRDKVRKFSEEIAAKFMMQKTVLVKKKVVPSYEGEIYRCFEGHLFIVKHKSEVLNCPSCLDN